MGSPSPTPASDLRLPSIGMVEDVYLLTQVAQVAALLAMRRIGNETELSEWAEPLGGYEAVLGELALAFIAEPKIGLASAWMRVKGRFMNCDWKPGDAFNQREKVTPWLRATGTNFPRAGAIGMRVLEATIAALRDSGMLRGELVAFSQALREPWFIVSNDTLVAEAERRGALMDPSASAPKLMEASKDQPEGPAPESVDEGAPAPAEPEGAAVDATEPEVIVVEPPKTTTRKRKPRARKTSEQPER